MAHCTKNDITVLTVHKGVSIKAVDTKSQNQNAAIPYKTMTYTAALALSIFLLSGCRTNDIKEHISTIEVVTVDATSPGRPTINLGGTATTSPNAQRRAAITRAATEASLLKKLDRPTISAKMQQRFVHTFMDGAQNQFHFRVEEDPTFPCNARIHIRISDYGLFSASDRSPVLFRLTANATMEKCDDKTVIWEKEFVSQQNLTNGNQFFPNRSIAGDMAAGVNAFTMLSLTADELEVMFIRLSEVAAQELSATLIEDAG